MLISLQTKEKIRIMKLRVPFYYDQFHCITSECKDNCCVGGWEIDIDDDTYNYYMSLEGATIYVTLFPCNECAKAIIQSGIREVVYDCDKYEGTASVTASKRMLRAAGVTIRRYGHTGREVTLVL